MKHGYDNNGRRKGGRNRGSMGPHGRQPMHERRGGEEGRGLFGGRGGGGGRRGKRFAGEELRLMVLTMLEDGRYRRDVY